MTTFSISDTVPTSRPDAINFDEFLRKHKVVTDNKGSIRFTTEPINPIKTSFGNGFVSAAFSAYNRHHHLVIRPDDVWLAIAVAFGNYVDTHSEEMRSMFVNHEGKKDLSITVNKEDWYSIVSTFQDLLPDHIAKWIIPNFSTTTKKDKLVGGAVLMGSMKNYFAYRVFIECGLPGVTLEGTLDDWKEIRKRVSQLEKWSESQPLLKKWKEQLLPVIDKLIESYQGDVDKEFWGQICNHIPGGSGPSHISGWINLFVPFKEGKWGISSEDPWNIRDGSKYPYGYLETGQVPTGCLEVPINVNDNGYEFAAILYAGAMVSTYDKETNEMRCSYDFAVIEKH